MKTEVDYRHPTESFTLRRHYTTLVTIRRTNEVMSLQNGNRLVINAVYDFSHDNGPPPTR